MYFIYIFRGENLMKCFLFYFGLVVFVVYIYLNSKREKFLLFLYFLQHKLQEN